MTEPAQPIATASLGEFGRIARLFRPLATDPGALDLQDDAALLSLRPGEQLVTTVDAIVEGVHFFGAEAPDLIARKLLRVNLSDIAAMGAVPRWYLLTIALPSRCDDGWVARFADGLAADQQEFAISLIGGDSISTPGPIMLSVTMMGTVPQGIAIRRSTARSDDAIFVSGMIGDAALGLLVEQGQLPHLPQNLRAPLAARYYLPQPRCALGPALRGVATAMTDISDGLVADLGHIASASTLGFVLDARLLPLSPATLAALQDRPGLLTQILTGGDDYELIFTAPPANRAALQAISRSLKLPITEIGHMSQVEDGFGILDRDGQALNLPGSGWQHR